MPTQTYFVDADGIGEFYQCVSPASPGQSPATHPAKWSKIQIPAFLRSAISERAAGQLLQIDGQSDKRAAANRTAGDALYETFIRYRSRGDYQTLPVEAARE